MEHEKHVGFARMSAKKGKTSPEEMRAMMRRKMGKKHEKEMKPGHKE